MAYSQITGITHESVPTEIINFAINTLGWSALDANTVAAPGADAGVGFRFRFEAIVTGSPYDDYRTYCELMKDGVVAIPIENGYSPCFSNAPYLQEVTRSPTKLHLLADTNSKQWLAAIIEYDPGNYRHLYAGYMEKIGNYSGGEVCSASSFVDWEASLSYRSTRHKYLFSGFNSNGSGPIPGGIRLVHADLGGEIIAPFYTAAQYDSNGSSLTMNVNAAIGGFPSNINDVLLAYGENSFAGVQMLVPVNCYLTKAANRICPIGRPPGVRLVNMTSVDPAAAITVGGKTWRCFPQFKKGGTSGVDNPNTTASFNILEESSYVVGYAYLED